MDISRTHTVHGEPAQTCPWKAAREAVSDADVFVGDYNHLFDDGVRESSLKAMDLSLEDIIIVVDEAHNLAEQAREAAIFGMFSSGNAIFLKKALERVG